jgi:hypothetical protein
VVGAVLDLLPAFLSHEALNQVKLSIIKLHYSKTAPGVRKNSQNPTLPAVSGAEDLFFGYPLEEVAKAITMVDWKLFSRIEGVGLLHKSWQSPDKYSTAPAMATLADRFVLISCWVATKILQALGADVQAEVLSTFIKLMRHLVKLRNHETALQILCGLNLACIQRLKHIWAVSPWHCVV